jgi:polysaccharide biosynthesis transport protein
MEIKMNNLGPAERLSDSEKTLQDYIDVILRRIWVVAAILAIVVVITVVYVFTRTPLYTSVATIELEEKSSKSRDKDSVYGTPEYDQFKGYLSTQVEILKSRSLAEELVARMNLLDDPEFSSKGWSLLGTVLSWFSGDSAEGDQAWQQTARKNAVVSNLMRRVNVKTVKTSNLLQVSMDATNRQLAAKLLQNYIDLYLERNLEKRRMESLQAATWLKEELESVDKKLRDAQVALLDFTIDKGIVDSKDGALGQVLGMLNKKMEGAIKAQEARAKVQALEDQDGAPESGVLLPKEVANNEYVGKLKQELAMMESEYTQMRGLYSPSYPKLTMLKKKIQFLTERIESMERSMVTTALSSAKKEEKILEGSYDTAKQETGRVRSLEAEYSSLKKDVDTNAQFQSILLKEYKQMDIRARTITNDIKMVDQPSLPNGPSWPKKQLFLLVGCLMGLVLGVAAAFVADRVDSTVQSPREIVVDLGAKRLGVVPDVTKLIGTGSDVAEGTRHEFLAYHLPRSPMSDAIRNIQTSIFLANPDHPTRCMAVSSATPSEGKTLIAVSIASVLTSDRSKKVVIVDGDLRRPRIHSVFGLTEPGKGLTSIFNGKEGEKSDLINSYDAVPGLFYLTSGPVPDDPVSILQSDLTKQMFQYLRDSFDYVIIDCPPILGFADTSIISFNADGLVMVARQGHVGRTELREAMEIISSANGCPLLGVVMNGAYAPGASKYWYRYQGHYYYSNRYNQYYSRKGA